MYFVTTKHSLFPIAYFLFYDCSGQLPFSSRVRVRFSIWVTDRVRVKISVMVCKIEAEGKLSLGLGI